LQQLAATLSLDDEGAHAWRQFQLGMNKQGLTGKARFRYVVDFDLGLGQCLCRRSADCCHAHVAVERNKVTPMSDGIDAGEDRQITLLCRRRGNRFDGNRRKSNGTTAEPLDLCAQRCGLLLRPRH
jgi:hypothetical protein